MTWLSDHAVSRLRQVVETPDLDGTRYEIVREIGRGGMGVIYEAFDRELERPVALKVVATAIAGETAQLVAREARIVAALDHPGIVPVHESGALPDGRFYYAMKLVRGARLDEWAAGDRPLSERLRLFARICEPVAFAHACGIVHRDLKPDNVMVGEFGAVFVMDWGVAGTAADEHRVIAGTPGYMAPEQLRGEAADARSDVYALGAILSFLLRGLDLKRPLAAILERASSTVAERRYRNAGEVAEEVLRFVDGQPVDAYSENVLEKTGRWLSRNRVPVALLAAYVVMRVVFFFWMRL